MNASSLKDYLKMDDEKLISIALEFMSRSEKTKFSISDFQFIHVVREKDRIKIRFGYNVIFLAKGSQYYKSLDFTLPGRTLSTQTTENSKDELSKPARIFDPQGEEKTEMLHAFKIVNLDPSILDHKECLPNLIEIFDRDDHYYIEDKARDPMKGGAFYKISIDKKTGETISHMHGHYARCPPIKPRNRGSLLDDYLKDSEG